MRLGKMGVIGFWACFGHMMPVAADPEPRISQFSGKMVPRFESLKYSTVNGRSGPSLDHPIAWRYERAGLPMLIVKESPDWRRVRDPEGAEVWVHARMLSSSKTGIVQRDLTLRKGNAETATPIAVLQAGVIVDIVEREEAWMKVRIDKRVGWVQADGIWGDPS